MPSARTIPLRRWSPSDDPPLRFYARGPPRLATSRPLSASADGPGQARLRCRQPVIHRRQSWARCSRPVARLSHDLVERAPTSLVRYALLNDARGVLWSFAALIRPMSLRPRRFNPHAVRLASLLGSFSPGSGRRYASVRSLRSNGSPCAAAGHSHRSAVPARRIGSSRCCRGLLTSSRCSGVSSRVFLLF
jgi:hypothetical protein